MLTTPTEQDERKTHLSSSPNGRPSSTNLLDYNTCERCDDRPLHLEPDSMTSVELVIDNQFSGAVNAQIAYLNTDGDTVSVPAGGLLVAGGSKRVLDLPLTGVRATEPYTVLVRDGASLDGVLLSNKSFPVQATDNTASVELGRWSTPAIILLVTLCVLVLIAGVVVCQRMVASSAAALDVSAASGAVQGLDQAAAKAYGAAADHAWM